MPPPSPTGSRSAASAAAGDRLPPAASAGGASAERRSRLRSLTRIAVVVLIAYLAVIVLMMFLENALIYFPTRYPDGDWQPVNLDFEDAWFTADDGTKLHGWYVPCAGARAAVLFCHGNAGNLSHRAEVLRVLHERVGVAVLILDYRGYGRSQGRPNEAGLLADARAARSWLARREKIDETEVVLMGRSLGGAVVVDLAAKDGAKALVLESTFTSLPDLAAHYYSWLPVRALMRTRFDSLSKIGSYRGPILQSHGDIDSIVPYEFGRRLFEAAGQPKQFLTLRGVDHNDFQPPAYYDQLAEFLDRLASAPDGS